LADKRHISWLYASRLTAEREFQVLNDLYPVVKVPEPIDQNRHAIIMGKWDGVELKRVDLTKLDIDIEKLFWDIVEEIKKMYHIGYVHGDLSEFNILINEEGDFLIIDFPQAIEVREGKVVLDMLPGEFKMDVEYYLKRDIGNVLRYFKKYGIRESVDEIYNYVVGK
ncbi:MAG TPA: serine/threonine protein kinase, partial [Methanothermococcus okinawensis]|nr:serine/threonine protein kinase [Methanothermococcus okinawensis]